jgi:hypothetical protein
MFNPDDLSAGVLAAFAEAQAFDGDRRRAPAGTTIVARQHAGLGRGGPSTLRWTTCIECWVPFCTRHAQATACSAACAQARDLRKDRARRERTRNRAAQRTVERIGRAKHLEACDASPNRTDHARAMTAWAAVRRQTAGA